MTQDELKAKKAEQTAKNVPKVGVRENHTDAKPAKGRQATWAEIQNVARGLTLDGKPRAK